MDAFMKRLYAKIAYAYARLIHPDYPFNGIVYLRQEENGLISWLCMERTTDTDLVFHPVQRWLKNILDTNEAMSRENQQLKEELIKVKENGNTKG